MIYTITFNPAIDYFLFVDKKVEDGSILKTDKTEMVAAGKGVNISLVLSKMNKPSKAVMFLGGYMGEFIKNQISADPLIEVCGVSIEEENRINVKIQNSVEHKESAINAAGPFVNEKQQEKMLEFLKEIKEGDFVVISGSYCRGVDKSLVKKIADLTRQAHAKLVCDVANLTLEDYGEIKPYLIKPNRDELGDIFKEEVTKENYMPFVDKLIAIGCYNVLLSLGKDGSYFANGTEAFRGTGPALEVVSTVGCGDTMLATTIGHLDMGQSFKEAVSYGEAAGRVKCTIMDFPTAAQVEEMLPRIQISDIK